MNVHTSFDTLGFVKRLSAAGMDARQAEALVEALSDAMFDTLVTKDDIGGLRNDLRELELRIAGELKALGLRLMGRMNAMIAGSTALTVAVLGALTVLG